MKHNGEKSKQNKKARQNIRNKHKKMKLFETVIRPETFVTVAIIQNAQSSALT